eukprot:GHVU01071258.1.p1 GENE.GHVU01071258.1~~GHVU01071258.1.p1  ORF type:complete len:375 (-),score=41.57 GHVU01071258.1:240-1364(-)
MVPPAPFAVVIPYLLLGLLLTGYPRAGLSAKTGESVQSLITFTRPTVVPHEKAVEFTDFGVYEKRGKLVRLYHPPIDKKKEEKNPQSTLVTLGLTATAHGHLHGLFPFIIGAFNVSPEDVQLGVEPVRAPGVSQMSQIPRPDDTDLRFTIEVPAKGQDPTAVATALRDPSTTIAKGAKVLCPEGKPSEMSISERVRLLARSTLSISGLLNWNVSGHPARTSACGFTQEHDGESLSAAFHPLHSIAAVAYTNAQNSLRTRLVTNGGFNTAGRLHLTPLLQGTAAPDGAKKLGDAHHGEWVQWRDRMKDGEEENKPIRVHEKLDNYDKCHKARVVTFAHEEEELDPDATVAIAMLRGTSAGPHALTRLRQSRYTMC